MSEEGLRVVKLCPYRRESVVVTDNTRTVDEEEAPANYVPAAAVIRMSRALSGIIGHKGHLGGLSSQG